MILNKIIQIIRNSDFIVRAMLMLMIFNLSACYFEMERSNSNDPDSSVYEPPVIEASFIPSAISGYVPLEVDFQDRSTGDIIISL